MTTKDKRKVEKPEIWQLYQEYEEFPVETQQQVRQLLYTLFAQTVLGIAGQPEIIQQKINL